MLRLTSRRAAELGAVLPPWVGVRQARPVSRSNALRQLMAAARYRAPLQAPVPRMLLLGSQNDGLVSGQCSQAIAQAWQVPLALHPSAGHDLPLDDGPWVLAQIRRWLAQEGAAGATA